MTKGTLIFLTLIGLETACFVYHTIQTPTGWHALYKLDQENQAIAQHIETQEKKNKELEERINDWNEDDFYKEQYAREKLGMAYPDEHVYLIPTE